MLLSEQLKEKLRTEFMPIKSLKIYSNTNAVNSKIAFLKSLDKGIRGVCSMILDFFEARVNTEESKDNYMLVYASQQEIGEVLGFSREYISHCINRMAESPICPFVKVRQGLNKANYYIMQKKKEIVEILTQIFKAQQEEDKLKNKDKQSQQKKGYKYNSVKVDNFTNYPQRTYDFEKLEKQLLGWDTE